MLSRMPVSYAAVKTASEPAAMAELLQERVLQPVLPSAKVRRVRARRGRRFEAPRALWNVYEVELELPGGVQATRLFWTKALFDDRECEAYRARIAGLLGKMNGNPLGPRGFATILPDLNMFLFFFPVDPVFPALGTVLNAAEMRGPLVEPLQRMGIVQPRVVEAELVKYLPEISAIVRYVAVEVDDSRIALYGKVQHSGKGAYTYQVMRALWDLPARAAGELVIAEPLAYYPEYDLLLQSEVAGEEVAGDRHSPVFAAQAETAGRVIGHIHHSGIDLGRPHTIDVEIDRLQNRLEEFKQSSADLYLLIRGLLNQILAQARRIPPEEPVPSHGDYKYNQFLYDGERFGLIDVEYFAHAEPSFDLGKYCGHLVPSMPEHWSDTSKANEARRVFLNAYQAVCPEYEGRRFPLYEALSLATRALVVTWSQTTSWEYTAETLVALGYERLKTPWGK
jgi:aminoglycoside phosphotransferase (APT) family kinase protein